MLWTEKYRPYSLRQLIGQHSFRLDAESWVDINDMPNVLLYGSAGTGKTAASYALARDMLKKLFDSNFFEINASDDRRLETVRTTIKDIAQYRGIGDIPFKIILLDEMDGMTNDAQNALKRVMERYSDNVRFIITCNDRTKIIYPLQSRCANYFFETLSIDEIKDCVINILNQEEKNIPEESSLIAFIGAYNGDLRRVVTELQAALSSNSPLKVQIDKGLEPYSIILSDIIDGNKIQALENLNDEIYAGKTIKDICISLHDVVINATLDSNEKFKLLRVIGESEWRSQSMTPRVLASWMIGQMN
tara:strand:- start:164 stop:1075 length:912 start_codon:yes stop_codon:yes gene_type:complete